MYYYDQKRNVLLEVLIKISLNKNYHIMYTTKKVLAIRWK